MYDFYALVSPTGSINGAMMYWNSGNMLPDYDQDGNKRIRINDDMFMILESNHGNSEKEYRYNFTTKTFYTIQNEVAL